MLVFGQIRVGLDFVLCVSTILGYHYRASSRLRLESFGICLDNKPRVRTPLRRYLETSKKKVSKNENGWETEYVEKGTIENAVNDESRINMTATVVHVKMSQTVAFE